MTLKLIDDYLQAGLPFQVMRKHLSLKEKNLAEVLEKENKFLYHDLKDWLPLQLIFKLHVCDKEWKEKFKQLFWQSFSYPLLLFFSYCILFLLYRLKITPVLLEQFSFFKTETFPKSFTYLNVFHQVNMFIVISGILFVFFLFKAKDLRMSFYTYLQSIFPQNPLTVCVNHHFVLLWSQLAENALSSPQAMKVLRTKSFATHVSWLAFQVESSLETDASFANHHLDDLLAYMIKAKDLETNYKDVFPRYLQLNRARIHYFFNLSAKITKVWIIFLLTCMIYQYYMSFYIPLQFWEVL